MILIRISIEISIEILIKINVTVTCHKLCLIITDKYSVKLYIWTLRAFFIDIDNQKRGFEIFIIPRYQMHLLSFIFSRCCTKSFKKYKLYNSFSKFVNFTEYRIFATLVSVCSVGHLAQHGYKRRIIANQMIWCYPTLVMGMKIIYMPTRGLPG